MDDRTIETPPRERERERYIYKDVCQVRVCLPKRQVIVKPGPGLQMRGDRFDVQVVHRGIGTLHLPTSVDMSKGDASSVDRLFFLLQGQMPLSFPTLGGVLGTTLDDTSNDSHIIIPCSTSRT